MEIKPDATVEEMGQQKISIYFMREVGQAV